MTNSDADKVVTSGGKGIDAGGGGEQRGSMVARGPVFIRWGVACGMLRDLGGFSRRQAHALLRERVTGFAIAGVRKHYVRAEVVALIEGKNS